MASQIARLPNRESMKGLLVPEIVVNVDWPTVDLSTVNAVARWYGTNEVLLFELEEGDQLVVAADSITISPRAAPINEETAGTPDGKYTKWGDIPPLALRFILPVTRNGEKGAAIVLNAEWLHRPRNYVGGGIPVNPLSLTVDTGPTLVDLFIGEWDEARIVLLEAKATPVQVLSGFSLVDQVPLGLDIPLQVEYGPAQGSPSDPAELLADGRLLIHQGGYYEGTAIYATNREDSAGVSYLFIRMLINGEQFGNPLCSVNDDGNSLVLVTLSFRADLNAGDVVTAEIARDSQGRDSGGLRSEHTALALGWGSSPSATITVRFRPT